MALQVGYVLATVVAIGATYGLYRKWKRKRNEQAIPYKVIIQSPAEDNTDSTEKRVVAVLGSTGFIGSHIAETLIATGRYRVYLLGRRFSPAKILPGADAVIQVDRMDYSGLVNALRGVDSVISSTIAPPTVFTTDDEVWRLNVTGGQNVVKACQEAGVKNLVLISGVGVKNIQGSTLKVVVDMMQTVEKYVLEASGLNSCVLQFGTVYGIRSQFFDKILSGEMTSLPKAEPKATFIPVEFVADATVRAELKLAENDELVTGKILKIGGHPSTFKEFLSLEEWGRVIKDVPLWLVAAFARVNSVVACVTGWAPLGPELSPAICSFLVAVELEVDNFIAEEALGIGQVPHIREGVAKMVAKFEERKKE